MTKAVIDIINGARRLTKDVELTASEYDSGTDADISEIREVFNRSYEYLIERKSDDFRYEYDLTTVASQKAYTLPVSSKYLSGINQVRLIDSTQGSSYQLYYYTEEKVESLYPNPDVDIEEGLPTIWWINTTSTAGSKELRFISTPDDAYTIRFYLQEAPSDLAGADLTGCSRKGDEWLQYEISATILESRGFAQAERYRRLARNTWKEYIGTSLFTNKEREYATPGFLTSRIRGSYDGFYS